MLLLEARAGFEPAITVLQTGALPLGDRALFCCLTKSHFSQPLHYSNVLIIRQQWFVVFTKIFTDFRSDLSRCSFYIRSSVKLLCNFGLWPRSTFARFTFSSKVSSKLWSSSPSRTWTYDTSVNSRMLYRLSYWGIDLKIDHLCIRKGKSILGIIIICCYIRFIPSKLHTEFILLFLPKPFLVKPSTD